MKVLFLFLAFASYTCSAQEAPACAAILDYAQHELPHWGILKNSGGFVYLDLDDDYIHKLVPFIQQEGFEEPPYFRDSDLNSDLIGAHISVIYSDEGEKYGIQAIQEYGKIIDFTLKECQVVHPDQWQEMNEVYFIVADAPKLDRIRKKYGLPKRKYDFHITIGVKPKI